MSENLREELQNALGQAYTIDRELGGGGMSRVFVARETALGRDVVVKVLPPDLAGELSAERFRREIQLAARLQHPHIVPVHSAGSAGTILFYTMPFIEGETLRARLQRSGELRVQDVIRMARELADALSYAHECGVVHRDLKPENVLITRGHAVVADFGVAKAVTESVTGSGAAKSVLTSVGLALGTPAYMAPEQAAGDPTVDHRADIYALGCVLYELLTGTPPFSGRPTQGLLAAHIAELPDPVGRRRPATPAPLAALVMSMLEKRPADRPQTADEIITALDSMGASGTTSSESSVSATAALPGRRAKAKPRSFTAWRVGIAGGLLAGIALVGVVVTNLASRRDVKNEAAGPLTFAIVAGDANESSSAVTLADKAIRDYLGDAVSTFDNAKLVPAGESARFVVSESTSQLGQDSLIVRARLVDGASGKVLRAFTPARVAISDPTTGLQDLLGHARAAVGMIVHPMLGQAALPASDAPNEQAFTEFTGALVDIERLLSGIALDRAKVAGQLDKAYQMDSSFVQPAMWATFLRALGARARKAQDSTLTEVVARHSAQLTSYERDLAELFRGSIRGDNGASVRSSERLHRETPAEWTKQAHARALIQVARYKDAIAILDSLALSANADDPQFWSDYVRSLHMLGDHSRELAVARRAIKLMPERRGVRSFEILALIALDSADAAIRAFDEAILLPEERDAGGATLTGFWTVAAEFEAHGQETSAEKMRLRAVPVITEMTEEELARSLPALAALGHDSMVVRIGRKILARDTTNFALSADVAVSAVAMGDTLTARREMKRIETAAAPLRPYTLGADVFARARIAAAMGDYQQAVLLTAEAAIAGQGFSMRRQIHSGREFRKLRTDPEIQKVMRPR